MFVAHLFHSDPNWNPEGGIGVQRGARTLGLGADGTGKDSVEREREERDGQGPSCELESPVDGGASE